MAEAAKVPKTSSVDFLGALGGPLSSVMSGVSSVFNYLGKKEIASAMKAQAKAMEVQAVEGTKRAKEESFQAYITSISSAYSSKLTYAETLAQAKNTAIYIIVGFVLVSVLMLVVLKTKK